MSDTIHGNVAAFTMDVSKRISRLIGHTPVVELETRIPGSRIVLKLEKFNPGGSMKDRMALGMVEDVERRGALRPGGTIIESSSGNTGTALAMIAAERGYRFIVVVDHHAARKKVRAMRAYGATIVEVGHGLPDGEVATRVREERAATIATEIPGAVFLEQAHNPANGASYGALASEIFESLDGCVDVLVGAVGTGGSLSGTARSLKALRPNLRVVGVEPEGSIIFGGLAAPYYQSGTGTPGGVEIGRNVNFAVLDEGRTVSDRAAFNTARFLARNSGVLIGGSAGGVVHVALDILLAAPAQTRLTVVALCADGGEKYLDSVFDDDWMRERDLLDPSVDARLRSAIAAWR